MGDNAPAGSKENDIKNYFGRKVAIDASMSIYQFLIAVRQQDGMQLTNEAGETTRCAPSQSITATFPTNEYWLSDRPIHIPELVI